MQIKKHIPNIITLLNLFCGCIAVVFVAELNFVMAFYFVCLGIFLDFFDGFFARLFKVAGELGLQLDSLADMVTSGVVPGYVMFWMLQQSQNPANGGEVRSAGQAGRRDRRIQQDSQTRPAGFDDPQHRGRSVRSGGPQRRSHQVFL